jgi:hypothetical protein
MVQPLDQSLYQVRHLIFKGHWDTNVVILVFWITYAMLMNVRRTQVI